MVKHSLTIDARGRWARGILGWEVFGQAQKRPSTLGDDGRGRFLTTEYTEAEKVDAGQVMVARQIFEDGGCKLGGNMV